MSNKKSGVLGETVRTVVYAVLIAMVVRIFAFEPFNIPSGSMLPTLFVGDYLFVSKFSYGFSRHSLPWGLPIIEGRIWADEPERGDVAVFKLPTDGRTDFIKRIVGLSGDTIQVKGGILHINGEPVKRERVGSRAVGPGAGLFVTQVTEYIETLPNGVAHRIWEISDRDTLDNTSAYKVPPGHYFGMGDNRDSSQDSRTPMVGFIPFENLVGRAEIMFFSHEEDANLWKFWHWPFVIRFSRIGNVID
jgi:signal peptidase I